MVNGTQNVVYGTQTTGSTAAVPALQVLHCRHHDMLSEQASDPRRSLTGHCIPLEGCSCFEEVLYVISPTALASYQYSVGLQPRVAASDGPTMGGARVHGP